MRRQGRDCVHQCCAGVPSAYSTVVRRWLCSFSSRTLVVPCVDFLAVLRLLLFGLWLGFTLWSSRLCGLVCSRPSFASVASRRPQESAELVLVVLLCFVLLLVLAAEERLLSLLRPCLWFYLVIVDFLIVSDLGRFCGIFRVAECPPGGEICGM